MHPEVYREFERLCVERNAGGAVLEIGAVPSDDSLLCMPCLKNAREKIGVNLDGPHTYRDFAILKGNANSMDMFEDRRFDTVLCNATLEHDPRFWKTLLEIRRVTKPRGLVVIGVPGYDKLRVERTVRRMAKLPLVGRFLNKLGLPACTLTLQRHEFAGDYYRFSPQAVRQVFFDGMEDVKVRTLMIPPRVIGSAQMPASARIP
jgi:SAM-dependent methyltransferase